MVIDIPEDDDWEDTFHRWFRGDDIEDELEQWVDDIDEDDEWWEEND